MTNWGSNRHLIVTGDARAIPLPDRSAHSVITSPPYFGLRDYKVKGQIGLEKTPSEYMAELVRSFREVWRVLRDDGTLWINIGDSYSSGGRKGHGTRIGYKQISNRGANGSADPDRPLPPPGIKAKDLLGIPWMLAFAMRDDGWYLRSEVVWSKPNPMPESVRDRPTRSHEQVFLLTKKPQYFYDAVATTEMTATTTQRDKRIGTDRPADFEATFKKLGVSLDHSRISARNATGNRESRNLRSVWRLSTESFPGAHFATFPTKLIIPMIKAGTSEKGCCPRCGDPWIRQVAKRRIPTRPGLTSKIYETAPVHPDSPLRSHSGDICGNRDPGRHVTETETVGWKPGCLCGFQEQSPCIVLDPFAGAGTVPLVAENLGRIGIGLELKQEYCRMAEERISRPHKPKRRARDDIA